ncbi:MAG: 4-hydroxy-3-methylbut-2-enyl diphosphate reductase, partial [Alphaproteobacteria bacterium]|nr:4-hydroxy-3-methylbut-2-enyl diphosphate reductase [Alphaproteobacteria bacterium]
SNSNRLREIGDEAGVPSHLIDDAGDLDPAWLDGVFTIGLSAGASAPEVLVEGILDELARHRTVRVESQSGLEENMHFKLPPELRDEEEAAATPS